MAALSSMQVLTIAVASSVAMAIFLWKRHSKKIWKPVAVVSELIIYPIKSCRPVSVQQLSCYEHGCEDSTTGLGDRSFMLIGNKGNRIPGSAYPALATVDVTRVEAGTLKLTVSGKKSILFQIPDADTVKPNTRVSLFGEHGFGIKCDDKVCEWFSELLGTKVTLIYHDKNKPLFHRDNLKGLDELSNFSKKMVQSRFQNFSLINLLSESSVVDLNTRLENKITKQNFRANIIVKGCGPYEEDEWKNIRIGKMELAFAKHCNRCPQTTVDYVTGVKDENMQPLKTLKTYRMPQTEQERKLYKGTPKFAVDLVPTISGVVSVGDTVYASIQNSTM